MKRAVAIFIFAILAAAMPARAALVSSNLLSYQLLTSTLASPVNTTSAVVQLGYIYLPVTTVTFQHSGVTNLPMLPATILIGTSTNPTAMVVFQGYNPAATNDGIDSVTFTNNGLIPLYMAVIITPTNTCSAGVQSIQQK